MIDKQHRQRKIAGFIQTHRIATQAELASRLTRAGIVTTQSSLSRDLEELGIIKANGHYALPQQAANDSGLLSLEAAGEALIVGKCEAGLASALTVKIDRAALSEVVGTIAGEDTIFIAVKDSKSQRTAMRRIWQIFSE